ncbi:glycosyltransferase [Negadavirga shengliensis]|uniref:Glycosyltransferase n=1 Tax=Negadavirga shengliensis TaxID=1389218 RepID=A0ABV9T2L3_9BACT
MNDARRLIIFSYEYPFSYSETFLHNEIQTLQKKYKEIIIIPSRIVWNKNLKYENKRVLPSGVSIVQENFSFRLIKPFLFIQLLIISFRFRSKFGIKTVFAVIKQSLKISFLIGFMAKKKIIQKDAIYYSYWKNESATAIAYLRNRGKIGCAVSRAHREDLYEEFGGLKPFDNFVGHALDKVYCISLDGKDYLLKKGFQASKVVVSRLGVYPSEVCSMYSSEVLHILSVSNVVSVKRVNLIAKAVLQLKMKVYWVHIGGGKELNEVQKLVETNSNENICIELMGGQSHSYVYDYYRNNFVDLFLNVSSSEGLPVSIMEAYSFGVPCMACDVGGNAEIIDPSWRFLLPAALDENQLANAIKDFYENRTLWKKFRRDAFQIWKNKYNAIDNFYHFAEDLENSCY